MPYVIYVAGPMPLCILADMKYLIFAIQETGALLVVTAFLSVVLLWALVLPSIMHGTSCREDLYHERTIAGSAPDSVNGLLGDK